MINSPHHPDETLAARLELMLAQPNPAKPAYDRIMLLTDASRDDRSFDAACYFRELLIDPDDDEPDTADNYDNLHPSDIAELRRLLPIASTDRELLTTMLLDASLCPLHRIDYAICFDDDDAECAAIRTIHPSHDT
jgi:hypothetical protein